MDAPIQHKRFTDTWQGRLAGILLAAVWIASMSMTGSNAYSYVPTLVGLALVGLLFLSAIIGGARMPRLTWISWLSLGVGMYLMLRCMASESIIEVWRELPLILGCFVFYLAGVNAAQARSAVPLCCVMAIAVALNILFWYLMGEIGAPMEWTGRPEYGIGASNTRPSTLFAYKNFGGSFLMTGGMMLAAACLFLVKRHKAWILLLPISLGGIYLSCFLDARAPYALAPVLLLLLWLVCLIRSVVKDDKIGLLTMLTGFAFLTALGVLVYDLLFGGHLLQAVEDIDSHSRYETWKLLLPMLHDAPPWGLGSGSVRWGTLPVSQVWNLINYAHNEFLELWSNYGLIGLALVAALLLLHVVAVFRCLFEERTGDTRRFLTEGSLYGIVAWSCCAFVDFVWHQFALASMTAFCFGLAASPFSATPKVQGRSPIAVRSESRFGRVLLATVTLLLLVTSGWLTERLIPIWVAQWSYNQLSQEGADDSGDARRELLASLVEQYPDSTLTDQYLTLPNETPNPNVIIGMLKQVLHATPSQLVAVNQLGELLSQQGKYEEAEALYRTCYPGEGPLTTSPEVWRNFYATNLLRWGESCLWKGEEAKALSLLQYAVTITKSYGHRLAALSYRVTSAGWDKDCQRMQKESAPWYAYVKSCESDLNILKIKEIQPDDSWQQPMEPNGKPSLYRSIIREAVKKKP